MRLPSLPPCTCAETKLKGGELAKCPECAKVKRTS